MIELGANLLIQTLDRAFQTMIRVPCAELGTKVIAVEHGISEMPGMKNMTKYINEQWPELECEFFCHEPFSQVVENCK